MGGTRVESQYKDVHVYEGDSGRSVLVVTSEGDVFGAGINSLVLKDKSIPMIEGGGDVLTGWVKIDKLCGLGIQKIVVDYAHGAALTRTNELVIWGETPYGLVEEEAIVMIQEYKPNTKCRLCRHFHNYSQNTLGGVPLSYCEVSEKHPLWTARSPPPNNVPVRKFVKWSDNCGLYCGMCSADCDSQQVIRTNISLLYCENCDLLWDISVNAGLVLRQQAEKTFKRVRVDEGIVDVACGWGETWVLTAKNTLVAKSTNYQYLAENRDNVTMTAVCCSERAGLFVTSEDGNIYRCVRLLNGRKGLGTLQKIPLEAPVTRACCGEYSAVCLLSDNSVSIITNYVTLYIDRETVDDIAAAPTGDVYYIRANETSVSRTLGVEINFIESDCKIKLLESVCSLPIASTLAITPAASARQPSSQLPDLAQTSINRATPQPSTSASPDAQSLPSSPSQKYSAPAPSDSAPLPAVLAELFGKTLFSDMTLKLSNGDFPAHRCVLAITSAYFNKTLSSDTAPHVTLDVSSFNPKAYKTLLKYYYQQQPDELDLDGLFDLWQLANIYGEIHIARESEEKIRAKINMDTVLHIFAMSKLFCFDSIKNECETLIRTHAFKNLLVERIIQDPTIFLLQL